MLVFIGGVAVGMILAPVLLYGYIRFVYMIGGDQ